VNHAAPGHMSFLWSQTQRQGLVGRAQGQMSKVRLAFRRESQIPAANLGARGSVHFHVVCWRQEATDGGRV
jgi:hypothetical protein